jgi:hypothetical protein
VNSFSERHGLSRPDAEITIRHEAPPELRDAVISIAYRSGLLPSGLRRLLCDILFRASDASNWSEFPNIDGEVRGLMEDLEWFEVYDLIEKMVGGAGWKQPALTEEFNRYFRIGGVGWQLIDGKIEVRGTEAFEATVRQGLRELSAQGRSTAANELHEALSDLSRRPNPEITGAIQHGLAALECLARDVCGSKETLGALINSHPDLFPKPIDVLVEKAWGYTSNYGRHLQEGKPPRFDEAELMVGLSGALCRYLARRVPNSAP